MDNLRSKKLRHTMTRNDELKCYRDCCVNGLVSHSPHVRIKHSNKNHRHSTSISVGSADYVSEIDAETDKLQGGLRCKL